MLPKNAILLLAPLLAAGCAVEHGSSGGGGPQGPPLFEELEPNDSPFAADFLGGVGGHDHFVVEGHVVAHGFDVYDHFEFVADEPILVEFWLDAWSPHADVDLSIVDPDSGVVLATYDSPHGSEAGSFTVDWAGKHFVLMVETWAADTGYSLEMLASHATGMPAGGDGDALLAPSSTGISFPDGVPPIEKEEHRGERPVKQLRGDGAQL